MKYVILFSFIFFPPTWNKEKNDFISFEYVGNANKPMRVAYISKKPLADSELKVTLEYNDGPENYIVYNNEFIFINKAINASSKKTFDVKDYNGFKINIRENNFLRYYFISRKNSSLLFLKINNYLKHNKRNKVLIYSLNVLRTSNVFEDQ